ncbi:MAG: hypothetical protein ABSA02_06850 [Trebonia sp.]|jgi:hypothetical protein
MRTLLAVLIGILLATGSAAVMVHDESVVRQAPVRVLFNYGSG